MIVTTEFGQIWGVCAPVLPARKVELTDTEWRWPLLVGFIPHDTSQILSTM
jgi:hypothetical protein